MVLVSSKKIFNKSSLLYRIKSECEFNELGSILQRSYLGRIFIENKDKLLELMFHRLIHLYDNHCHIIISETVNYLYINKLTFHAQQIRNKFSYRIVNIIKEGKSKYKIKLILK
jgi:hypothetical protein